ncbi:MAG: UDP-N-acetylmuramoyl-L-alanyl-D-glutamate--2,6-diaminopimelate ligase [Deinococcus sp.]|nr:UDP-N-acetylmuramoyl-L-alanyl-D-glutamate--2,6-diaminopimelate ligase [Deinococcus sp.]
MVAPTLDRLFAAAGLSTAGLPATLVTGVTHDSRQVAPGMVFVALRGRSVDGNYFVAKAAQSGALCVVSEQPHAVAVPCVTVPSARSALADLACAFYQHPSRQLVLVGVTGTDGKTTVCHLLDAIFRAAGHVAGLIGTVETRIASQVQVNRTDLSTPEALEVQHLLREMVDAGVTHGALEVSSHALAQHRVRGCRFLAAVVTNITPEHRDFHQDLERYRAAKRELVKMAAAEQGTVVLNRDDSSFLFLAEAAEKIMPFGLSEGCAVTAREVQAGLHSSRFRLVTPQGERLVTLPLSGTFNVFNALAAAAAAQAVGVGLDAISQGLEHFPGVPGRMEILPGANFTVVVDYAHTPGALEQLLQELRRFCRGRLTVVMGMAAKRDPLKRAEIGRVIARLADQAIITEDDSRGEDLYTIMQAIAAGASALGWREGVEYQLIADRRTAIERAVARAAPGDIVLLAGKGHERHLARGAGDMPWNERLVAELVLKEQGRWATSGQLSV